MASRGRQTLIVGWGGATWNPATVVVPGAEDDWAELFRVAGPRGLIARGGGRSYGDAAQNAGGLVVPKLAEAVLGDVEPAAAPMGGAVIMVRLPLS